MAKFSLVSPNQKTPSKFSNLCPSDEKQILDAKLNQTETCSKFSSENISTSEKSLPNINFQTPSPPSTPSPLTSTFHFIDCSENMLKYPSAPIKEKRRSVKTMRKLQGRKLDFGQKSKQSGEKKKQEEKISDFSDFQPFCAFFSSQNQKNQNETTEKSSKSPKKFPDFHSPSNFP
eukprot:Sdes_comp9152_c0_seq1m622